MITTPLLRDDDVLLAIVLEGIAAKRIPLRTEQDLAALYRWLQVITSQPLSGPR
jgi:hypothetical protein